MLGNNIVIRTVFFVWEMDISMSSHGTTPGQSVGRGRGYIHLVVVVVIVLSYNIFFHLQEGERREVGGIFFLREPDFFSFVNSFFSFLRLDESSTSLCSCFLLFFFHACPLAPPAAPPSSPSSSRTLKRQPTFFHKFKTVKFEFETW